MINYLDTIKEIRPIYNNINDERILPYIAETLSLIVIPALGAPLYHKIEENPENYSEILNGGYLIKNDKEIYLSGLKKAVAYLTYSRLIQNNQIQITTYGVDYLQSENADKVSLQDVTYQRNQAQQIGEKFLKEIVDYLTPCNKVRFTKIKVL